VLLEFSYNLGPAYNILLQFKFFGYIFPTICIFIFLTNFNIPFFFIYSFSLLLFFNVHNFVWGGGKYFFLGKAV